MERTCGCPSTDIYSTPSSCISYCAVVPLLIFTVPHHYPYHILSSTVQGCASVTEPLQILKSYLPTVYRAKLRTVILSVSSCDSQVVTCNRQVSAIVETCFLFPLFLLLLVCLLVVILGEEEGYLLVSPQNDTAQLSST